MSDIEEESIEESFGDFDCFEHREVRSDQTSTEGGFSSDTMHRPSTLRQYSWDASAGGATFDETDLVDLNAITADDFDSPSVKRMFKKKWWLIHPESTWKTFWDYLVALIIVPFIHLVLRGYLPSLQIQFLGQRGRGIPDMGPD